MTVSNDLDDEEFGDMAFKTAPTNFDEPTFQDRPAQDSDQAPSNTLEATNQPSDPLFEEPKVNYTNMLVHA